MKETSEGLNAKALKVEFFSWNKKILQEILLLCSKDEHKEGNKNLYSLYLNSNAITYSR